MNRAIPCCQDSQLLTDAPSPFHRIIALGFYDGLTDGVLQCAACGAVYKFDMLDWNEDHHVRIFRLAPLPPEAWPELVRVLAQPPRWPVWIPPWNDLLSDEVRDAEDRKVEDILNRAGVPNLLIAATSYGERILAARKGTDTELLEAHDWFTVEDPKTLRDWFAVLGLDRGKSTQSRHAAIP